MEATELLTPREAAHRFKLSVGLLYRAIYRGRLPARRRSRGRWVLDPQDVERWLAALQAQPARSPGERSRSKPARRPRKVIEDVELLPLEMVGPTPDLASLTPRERVVLFMMRQGASRTTIANTLQIRADTVKRFIRSLRSKLGDFSSGPGQAGSPRRYSTYEWSRWTSDQGLSLREGQVLALLIEGARPAAIARTLGVRADTVREHIRSLRRKACSEPAN